ncbi:MAG: signal recognition particle protein [Acidobacteriota bacterium]|nr:signal recognition particle protein [Acidobacteriota bacterium]
MFEQLTEKIQRTLKYIRGEGKITEKNISEALKMIRLAFLEADVNYKVVKEFEGRVKAKALNQEVMMSLTPGQQFIKIVRDELTDILGQEAKPLYFASQPPSVFMLIGLQGSGKTTTAGKLAKYVKGFGKNPLLVSFDLKRLAAQDQLRIISKSLGLPFYEMTAEKMKSPAEALKELVTFTRNHGYEPLIVDTAGRLHIDEDLMKELRLVREILEPTEVIYVGDSMTGQDAVRSAQAFDEKIGLTSIILTKLDGDARGGAALSIAYVTKKPIKFVGLGEKFDKLEIFHPDRMASRILGLGDILSLIEKAEQEADLKQAEEIAKKIKKQQFTLEDFRQQLIQLKKMGSLSGLLDLLPKAGPFRKMGNLEVDDKKLVYFEAIINSMTLEERDNPRIIDGRRRARIARGSGRPVQEVNQLLKQFFEMEKLLKKNDFQKLIKGL